MIGVVMRVGWWNLKRDRVALALTFLLPLAFFSIFAKIFSSAGGGSGGPPAIRVNVVDEDGTPTSGRFLDAFGGNDGIDMRRGPLATEAQPDPAPWTRGDAIARVRDGKDPAALVVPAGFAEAFGTFGPDAARVEVIHDAANPLARHMVAGLVQAAAFTAAPDVLMERGLGYLEEFGGALTPDQRRAVDEILPALRGDASFEEMFGDDANDAPRADDPGGAIATEDAAPADTAGFAGLVAVEAVAAQRAEGDDGPDIVAYYAAGIGVMFLLFSMAGAAGSLLEAEEFGTLERLLASRLGMGGLILGNWLFFVLVGIAQLLVLFAWAAVAFGLDLGSLRTCIGAVTMTVATSAAAAAFGMMLATLCRSRGQLSGISTIVIVILSALGGSMVPRFVAPFLEKTSRFTFNGWALDGFLKVFWYAPEGQTTAALLVALLPAIGVLTLCTLLFLGVARLAARRWEVA